MANSIGYPGGYSATGSGKEYLTSTKSTSQIPRSPAATRKVSANAVADTNTRRAAASDLGTSAARKESIKLKNSTKGSSSSSSGGYSDKDSSGSGGGYSGESSSSSGGGGSSSSGKKTKVKKGFAVVTGSSAAVGATGLNASRIVAIETALDAYIKSVTSAIHVASTKKNVALAIKGAAAQAEVRKYIASMDSACEKLFKDLEKYKKILEQMKSNYASNDKFNNSVTSASAVSFTPSSKVVTDLTNTLKK